MTRLPLSTREARIVAIGALTVGTLLMLRWGLPQLQMLEERVLTEARLSSAAVIRASEAVRQAASIRDSAEARTTRYLALAPLLLDGSGPEGGSSLVAAVAAASENAGTSLNSIRILGDSPYRQLFNEVTVAADLTADIAGLARLLVALEEGPRLMAVRELSILQQSPDLPDDRTEELSVRMTIAGIRLGNRGSGSLR